MPSPDELDDIIAKGDALAITKTIQIVVSSDTITCEQKVAYLSDFFGRINTAVKIKNFTLTQIKIIVEIAEE